MLGGTFAMRLLRVAGAGSSIAPADLSVTSSLHDRGNTWATWVRFSETSLSHASPWAQPGVAGAWGVELGSRGGPAAACEMQSSIEGSEPSLASALRVPLTRRVGVRLGILTHPEVIAWGLTLSMSSMLFQLARTTSPLVGPSVRVSATWSPS